METAGHHQEEGEAGMAMPMPINSSSSYHYHLGFGRMIHAASGENQYNNVMTMVAGSSSPTPPDDHPAPPLRKKTTATAVLIRYRECMKNHAAGMGGNATDGCGEFMPSGEEGSLEALTCSACACHRNFHRKEVQGEPPCYNPRIGRKLFLGHHQQPALGMGYHHHHHHHHRRGSSLVPSPGHIIMSYNPSIAMGESDEDEEGLIRVKKRFRTKFTQEQKEKMLKFAENVGWKLQKQEEAVVQQFCQEVGVKRRVLKVWMHNNKHNLAKKNHQLQTHPHNQDI